MMSSIAELQKQVREGKELRITGDVDNTDKEFINIVVLNWMFFIKSRTPLTQTHCSIQVKPCQLFIVVLN